MSLVLVAGTAGGALAADHELDGTYVGEGVEVMFKAGELWVGAPDADKVVMAAFVVDGDQVTITSNAASTTCEAGQTGTYTWSRGEDGLTLAMVEDSCEGRAEALPGTWPAKAEMTDETKEEM